MAEGLLPHENVDSPVNDYKGATANSPIPRASTSPALSSLPGRAATAPAATSRAVGAFSPLRVLIGCEYSGRVRQAFRDLGHDAWSCDILQSEDDSPHHVQGDVRNLFDAGWDLAIFHPPCTRLCNSGVRWLAERDLWADLDEGAAFFLACLNAPIPRVAVENPVMHKYAREIVGRGPDFTVQPWQFGDPAKKRTCFWTRGLPPLVPTSNLTAADARADCHLATPGPDRWKERSRTYPGLAAAMAAQWSTHTARHTHGRADAQTQEGSANAPDAFCTPRRAGGAKPGANQGFTS